MVNDLNTLSGALVECKDQLITELANKGVTATFDPTTGLLGLIAHIADIQGGGAVVDTLTITTNKTILSYLDSDTCTITVTATDNNNQPIANAPIRILINGLYSTTLTTDNQGEATYTYNSTGTGDTVISAINSNTTASTKIEDCYYYNTEITQSFTGSSTSYYNIQDLGATVDCEITATINTNNTHGLALLYKQDNSAVNTDYVRVGTGAGSWDNLAIFTSSNQYDESNIPVSDNTDFTVKIRLKNNKVELYSNTIRVDNYNVGNVNYRYLGLFSWNSTKTITVKDLKVKLI